MRLISLIATALIGMAFAWLIGRDGAQYNGVPVLFICAAIAFAINWLAFVPAWFARTEKFYDLTGAITYFSVIATAVVLSGTQSAPALVVAAMVVLWCLRLGSMLFIRVMQTGEDKRFRAFKVSPLKFLTAWTTQGLWVVITAACALVVITHSSARDFDLLFIVGAAMWAAGLLTESIADRQKNVFRKDPVNQGKFIRSGLWAWSQHPNYFGEILLWAGIAVIAVPQLQGWSYLALISPVFVYVLLVYISGINMLDDVAQERWGDDADYQRYIASTSKLVPLPPKAG